MLIVANWKAYIEDIGRAKKLVALSKKLARASTNTIVLAPPAPFIGALAHGNTSAVAFAAQDISTTTGGAKTGESTAQMFASLGASYAIIGHSERRAMGDAGAAISEKLSHALACSLTPILCIGEQERDREGRYLNVVREEITSALSSLTSKERTRIIIAYEPLWAIGKTAENAIRPGDLTEMALYIRKVLSELLPGRNSQRALVLYGGSVEPEGARSLAGATRIDGFLVGHSSVEEQSFSTLVKELS